jgi:dTDP-4-dehydrorhamnose 3,5-epimerase
MRATGVEPMAASSGAGIVFEPTSLPGCVLLRPPVREDERGRFVKYFHAGAFTGAGLATEFREDYYSVSQQGVLRGLHFQLPPHAHDKLVVCLAGEVLDVALDLRRGSPTYGRHFATTLSGEESLALFMPAGMAHGFYVTRGPATLLYKVGTVYEPSADSGILWSSAGIDWPDPEPLLSARDRGFPTLAELESPFTFASPS